MDSDIADQTSVERNVLGDPLVACTSALHAGKGSDGRCRAGADTKAPTVCAVMTQQFLVHERSRGIDLTRPDPHTRSRGLRPGDSWCLPAARWRAAYEEGSAPPVQLDRTFEHALAVVTAESLLAHAVDVPADPRGLLD